MAERVRDAAERVGNAVALAVPESVGVGVMAATEEVHDALRVTVWVEERVRTRAAEQVRVAVREAEGLGRRDGTAVGGDRVAVAVAMAEPVRIAVAVGVALCRADAVARAVLERDAVREDVAAAVPEFERVQTGVDDGECVTVVVKVRTGAGVPVGECVLVAVSRGRPDAVAVPVAVSPRLHVTV